MISKVQSASGSITKAALETIREMTAARANDGAAKTALLCVKRGLNVTGVEAFSESGASRLAVKGGKEKYVSLPSFVFVNPAKGTDKDFVTRYNPDLHKLDNQALEQLTGFVAVA